MEVDITAAITRRQTTGVTGQPATPPETGRLLTVEQAAEIAGVPPSWLLRRVKSLPFARKLSHKVVRFSELGLRKWLATRRP